MPRYACRLLSAVFATLPIPAQDRVPIPDVERIAISRSKVEEAFANQFAQAKLDAPRLDLARDILALAQRESEPANKYALLAVSLELFEQAHELEWASKTVSAIGNSFEVDTLRLRSDLLRRFDAYGTGSMGADILRHRLLLILDAAKQHHFDLAEPEVALAEKALLPGALSSIRRALLYNIRKRAEAFRAVSSRSHALILDPTDDRANAIIGEHFCFFEERWRDSDITALARANAPDYGSAATLEASKVEDSPEYRLRLGDLWWEAAKKSPDYAHAMQRRAAHHYGMASADASALDRLTITKRIRDARSTLDPWIAQVRKFHELGDTQVGAALAMDLKTRFPHLAPADLESEMIADRRTSPVAAIAPSLSSDRPALPSELYSLRGRRVLSQRAEAAIQAASDWLIRHQDQDGRWDAERFMKHDAPSDICSGPGLPTHSVGTTSLAVLALIGADGIARDSDRAIAVTSGIRWLLSQQSPSNGIIGSDHANEFIYDHALATLALAEAYGLMAQPNVRRALKSAVDYLEEHRNPLGAWRYRPRGDESDTSVTATVWMALRAARDFGVEPSESSARATLDWIDTVTDGMTGRIGYTDKGSFSSRRAGDHGFLFPRTRNEAMTGAGLLCQYLLGRSPSRNPIMQAQARLIAGRPPENDRQSIDFHAWFLCTNAMRQVGGQAWVEWYDVTLRVLTELQCEQGSAKGSWDPIDVWGEDGGRVYSTAMATLTLLAPVRYAELATIAPVPDTNEFRRLRSAWLRRNFETVSTELERLENDDDLLSDEDRALVSLASQQLLAERENAARVVDWYRVVPDYLSAETQLEAIAKEFGELAEGVSATKVLADMRREPGSSRELKAAKEYSRVLQKYSGSSLRNGLLNFISKDMYSGTKAQATAAALLQEIRD